MIPERIVCLAAEIPEMLARIGALERVVGISAYTTSPPEALELPKVSAFQTGNMKKLLGLNPDLAILTSNVQKDLANRLADAGIPVLHLQPHRLQDLFHSIALVGNIVGLPEQARRLNDGVREELDKIGRMAEWLPKRPRVYFEEWMDPLICGTGWVSDLIELAGGQDVFRERSIQGKKAQERVITSADIIQADPELILAAWCGKPFIRSQLLARSQYAGISAVRQDQIYEINSQILQCGPLLVQSARELYEHIKACAFSLV